jgi:excinuclease ABC subunit B
LVGQLEILDGSVFYMVIPYTGSMKRAIDETERREIQMQYNKDNNIKPESIKKDIRQALDEDILYRK